MCTVAACSDAVTVCSVTTGTASCTATGTEAGTESGISETAGSPSCTAAVTVASTTNRNVSGTPFCPSGIDACVVDVKGARTVASTVDEQDAITETSGNWRCVATCAGIGTSEIVGILQIFLLQVLMKQHPSLLVMHFQVS